MSVIGSGKAFGQTWMKVLGSSNWRLGSKGNGVANQEATIDAVDIHRMSTGEERAYAELISGFGSVSGGVIGRSPALKMSGSDGDKARVGAFGDYDNASMLQSHFQRFMAQLQESPRDFGKLRRLVDIVDEPSSVAELCEEQFGFLIANTIDEDTCHDLFDEVFPVLFRHFSHEPRLVERARLSLDVTMQFKDRTLRMMQSVQKARDVMDGK